MKRFCKSEGFTLLELIVAIAVGSIITLAACTVLMLGLSVNGQSTETASRQNTARVLMTALENLAGEGGIKEVVSDSGSWEIKGENGPIFSYNSWKQTVYTGAANTGTPLMEGVTASHVTLSENNLLTFSVETEDGIYSSSVYCRTVKLKYENEGSEGEKIVEDLTDDNAANDPSATNQARAAFLKKLAGQYKMGSGGYPNPGLILNANGTSSGDYYSEWYIGGYDANKPGWDKDTPWCACFVSWALNEVSDSVASPADRSRTVNEKTEYYWYASVDQFMEYLKDEANTQKWYASKSHEQEGVEPYSPLPGDLIFFSWIGSEDPAHMGVVLTVDDDNIYTIEGNSAGVVAVRKYALGDNRIVGYGVLDWKADQPEQ